MPNIVLNPGQERIFYVDPWHDESRDVVLAIGGLGAGKTKAAVWTGLALATKFPGTRGFVGHYNYTTLARTALRDWREYVQPNQIVSWSKSSPNLLVLKNGSTVEFISLEDAYKLRSAEYNWGHIEEASALKDPTIWREALARLRLPWTDEAIAANGGVVPKYRLILTTNPEVDAGWIHETFIEPDEDVAPHVRCVRISTRENAHNLPHRYIEALEASMSADDVRIYIDGYTGNLKQGLVYHAFEPSRNVRQCTYDAQLPLEISFDFNVDFLIALIFQEKNNGDIEVIGEAALQHGVTTDNVCTEILKRYGGHRAGVTIHGDPSGFHRDTRSLETDYDLIHQQLGGLPGFGVESNRKDVGARWLSLRNRTSIANGLFCSHEDKSRLFIDESCTWLIKGLRRLRWDPKKDGWEKLKVRDPSRPEYYYDHPTDALDYFIGKRYFHGHGVTIL